MVCVFILCFLGASLVNVSSEALRLTSRVKNGTIAFNIAESGAERAARWLKDQPSPPSGTATISPFGGSQTLGPGTYTVTVTPSAGNSGAPLKSYTITSVGTVYGRTERVSVFLRQQSFGKYAYFTDSETSSITGGRIWFFSGDRIRGPAHSNNVGGSNFQIDWTTSTSAIFQDMVTAAGPSMSYSPAAPSNEAEFTRIYAAGSRGFQLGVDPIALPPSTDIQRNAAWGAASGFPGSNGVYVPAGGGIYIAGDSTVLLQLDGSGNQQFRITQGSTVTTVTVDLVNNRRTVQVGSGSPTTVAGSGSGVVYTTGNITSLSGTVADNWLGGGGTTILGRSAYTIAADVNSGKDITVTNPIRYNSAPDPTQAINAAVNLRPGTLGLMARNVTVASGTPTSMEIDAVVLAGSSSTSSGSFSVADYNTKKPTGTLKLVGGLIQKARGPVGTLSSGVLNTGYAKDYYYDPRLADNPPPFFATTGLYDRLSWQRLTPG
jgi:hypothetical protein